MAESAVYLSAATRSSATPSLAMERVDHTPWSWRGGFGGDRDWRQRGLSDEHAILGVPSSWVQPWGWCDWPRYLTGAAKIDGTASRDRPCESEDLHETS